MYEHFSCINNTAATSYHFLSFFNTVTTKDFIKHGLGLIGIKVQRFKGVVLDRRFRAFFGTCPQVCVMVWRTLTKLQWFQKNNIKTPNFRHLLWALQFLKAYDVQEIHACEIGIDKKTWRKWIWKYVEAITSISKHVVCF